MPAATAEHTQQSLSELSLAELKQLCTELTIDGHRGKKQTYIDALLEHQKQQRQLEASNGQMQLFDTAEFTVKPRTYNHYDMEDGGCEKPQSRRQPQPQPQPQPELSCQPQVQTEPDPEPQPQTTEEVWQEVEILYSDWKLEAGRYRVKVLQQKSNGALLQFEPGTIKDDRRFYFTSDFRIMETEEPPTQEEPQSFIPSPLFPIPPAEPEEDGDRDKEEVERDRQVSDRPPRLNPNRIPPIFGKNHRADEIGQLSLFEWEDEDKEEAPDPDDFPSVGDWEKAWKEWSLTHELPPGFSSPDTERALSFPAAKCRGAITRTEAASALGIECDRIVKDPTELWNAVVVVYLDDAGKRRSRFVSYRKFRRWWQSFIDSLFTEAIAQTVRRELERYGDYCPPDLRGNLESLRQSPERRPAIEREAIAA